jgi:serine/threonine protein kinase
MAYYSGDRLGRQLGTYRLLRLLGRGGFAEVYLGEDVYLNSRSALKVLQRELNERDIESFAKEAQTLALLRHPHILSVLDFAVENGTPFLVTEYAPNGTLRDRHPRGSRLPLETIVTYIQQVASALQYAHDHRIIHRDIKPENMLLGARGEVLLADFGLALFTPDTHSFDTVEIQEALVGTVSYSAPEQLQGDPKPESDQYSLAVVVYEWLCGRLPFRGSLIQIITQHLSAAPPSVREQVPELPSQVEEVVFKALAKDPHQRFARVQDFATALELASRSIPLFIPEIA